MLTTAAKMTHYPSLVLTGGKTIRLTVKAIGLANLMMLANWRAYYTHDGGAHCMARIRTEINGEVIEVEAETADECHRMLRLVKEPIPIIVTKQVAAEQLYVRPTARMQLWKVRAQVDVGRTMLIREVTVLAATMDDAVFIVRDSVVCNKGATHNGKSLVFNAEAEVDLRKPGLVGIREDLHIFDKFNRHPLR